VSRITVQNGSNELGGGIYGYNSNPLFREITIRNNSAEQGGGIYLMDSSPYIINVTIVNNYAILAGGAVYAARFSRPLIVNGTVSYNQISEAGTAGGLCLDNYYSALLNCIIWNNDGEEITGDFDVYYSDISGGWEGEGNIDADPCFIDPANGNYQLQAGSPCIDAGTAFFVYNGSVLADLEEDEYWGIAPDMGAFEYGLVNAQYKEVPPQLLTLQNYPNPFNPETRISFTLPEDGRVGLSIYNLKGQLVKRLIMGEIEAGEHFVDWGGRNVSSGVYLVRLEAGEQVLVNKIMLIK
jgi:hypothetical protein